MVVRITYVGHFLQVAFGHLALLASESVLGFCQSPPVCAHASLSQDGF